MFKTQSCFILQGFVQAFLSKSIQLSLQWTGNEMFDVGNHPAERIWFELQWWTTLLHNTVQLFHSASFIQALCIFSSQEVPCNGHFVYSSKLFKKIWNSSFIKLLGGWFWARGLKNDFETILFSLSVLDAMCLSLLITESWSERQALENQTWTRAFCQAVLQAPCQSRQ